MRDHLDLIGQAIEAVERLKKKLPEHPHQWTEEHRLQLDEIRKGVLSSCQAVQVEVNQRLETLKSKLRQEIENGLVALGAKGEVLKDATKSIISQRQETSMIHEISCMVVTSGAESLVNVPNALSKLLALEAEFNCPKP